MYALFMTQTELAAAVDVSKLTVSRWERGALRPSRESVQNLTELRDARTRRGVLMSG